jgi:hypothetical protein
VHAILFPALLLQRLSSHLSGLPFGSTFLLGDCNRYYSNRNPCRYTVAVKTVIADAHTGTASAEATSDLLDEAIVMSRVGRHPHVCMLVGVVTSGLPLLLVCSCVPFYFVNSSQFYLTCGGRCFICGNTPFVCWRLLLLAWN